MDDNIPRDFDAERTDAEIKFAQSSARSYLKSVQKVTYDRREPDTNDKRIAYAALAYAQDNLVGDSDHDNPLVVREQIVDVVTEIIRQGIETDPRRKYESLIPVDLPKKEPKKNHLAKLDTAMSDVHFAMAELSMDNQNKELRKVMAAANSWGERDDITPLERCHGLAHQLYGDYGQDTVMTADSATVPTDPGRNYARAYDHEFADKIKERSMRAAKELFGS